MRNLFLIILLTISTTFCSNDDDSIDYTSNDNKIYIYGPGGPHVYFLDIEKLFEEKYPEIDLIVTYGPESSWIEKAKINADFIFGSSEQSQIAVLESLPNFNINDSEPIAIRECGIIVKKGNPLGINSFEDLINRKINIIANEGKGSYNTSGTGLWEDVASRKGSLEMVIDFKKNIINYSQGSGASYKNFKEKGDAWIQWIDFYKSHLDEVDFVKLDSNRVIYRDINLVAKNNEDNNVILFLNFIKTDKSKDIMNKYGWSY